MNVDRIKTIMVLLVVILTCALFIPVHAAVIFLKDGSKFEGELVIENNEVFVKNRDLPDKLDFGKVSKIKFCDVVNTYVLVPAERQHPQILIRHGVPLEQSEVDAINGIVGKAFPLNKKEPEDIAYLSDAKNSKEPADPDKWFAGEIVWDLGDKINPLERELAEVSIWIRSDDKSRCDYSGSLEVSEGGNIFIPIDGTYTNVNFYELFGRGFANTFNNVRYYFSPGAVTGFRYLKLKANPSAWSHNESRFVEVDVFVNRVKMPPPQVISAHLENGTVLNGIWKSIDDKAVKILVEKTEFVAPLIKISKILIRNVNNEHQKYLNCERLGVLLCNGDFIDGEVVSIDEGIISVSSALLGEKKLSIRLNVVAIFLKKPDIEKSPFKVLTKFGSIFNAQDLSFKNDGIEFRDSVLGKVAFGFDKVAEIEFLKN
jgi:hypothetical protein